MKWIKLQSPSRELTLWGAYVGRFEYTLSYHSGAMKWACSTKLSGSAEPSTPLGEFDHWHEAVAACEQHPSRDREAFRPDNERKLHIA